MGAWRLEPVVSLDANATAAVALEELAGGGGRYAVIGGPGELTGVLSAEQLSSLAHDPRPLAALADDFDGIVTLEDAARSDDATVAMLARALLDSHAIAVLVTSEDGALVGAIPREAVAAAVSPAALAGSARGYGRPDVRAYQFVCRVCMPPSYRLPGSFDELPRCLRDFRHGTMEPDAGP